MYEWWIWGEEVWKGNPVPALAYSFGKPPRGPPGLRPYLTEELLSTLHMPSYFMYCGGIGVGINQLFWKSPKGSARLNVPILRKNCYQPYKCLDIFTLRRDLEINPGIFGTETCDWGSAPPSLPAPGIILVITNLYLPRDWRRDQCVHSSDSALRHSDGISFFFTYKH